MFTDGTCTSSKPHVFKTADSAPLQNATPFQSSLSLVHRVARHSTFCHSRRILGLRELFHPSGPTSTLHYNRTPMHASTTRVSGVRQVRTLLYPKIPPLQREESVRDVMERKGIPSIVEEQRNTKRMKHNMRFKLANTVQARCAKPATSMAHSTDTTVMEDVIGFITLLHASVTCAVEHWKCCREGLPNSITSGSSIEFLRSPCSGKLMKARSAPYWYLALRTATTPYG